LGFQQIQGGQQITILGLRTFGERNSWLTGMAAELYFILNNKMKEVFGGSFVRMGVVRVIEIGE
jgi:hypothetical protein